MATAPKTWYATNTLVNLYQQLSETSPGANATSSPATGWIVGTTAPTVYSEFAGGTKQINSTFSATARPDGSINTALGDCLRSATPYRGSFASANWTFTLAVIGVTNSGSQGGRARFRLFRSINADGSGATEITSAAQVGSTVTALSTTQQSSTIAFNPGAFSLADEYLFVQVGWEVTTAGGMTTTDVVMRIGATASTVVSANFTPTYVLFVGQGSTFGAFGLAGKAVAFPRGRYQVATAGAYVATGQAATLSRATARVLNCAVNWWGLTGNAASFPIARYQAATAGAYTATGQAATLTRGTGGGPRTLTAGLGDFNKTFASINAHYAHNQVITAGAYTATGQAATLTKGTTAARTLSASAGAFVLTGNVVARFPITHNQAATAGAYTATGQAATLTKAGAGARTLTATQGAFTLTGQALNNPRAYTRPLTQLSFGLSGQPVTLSRTGGGPRVLTATQGSFVLTGRAVLFPWAHRQATTPGAYTATGQAVALTKAAGASTYTLTASSRSFVLTGQAANFLYGHARALTQLSFALTGETVTLTKAGVGARTLTATAGAFALTGQATNLRVGHLVGVPTAGAFVLTGRAQNLLRGRLVGAAFRSFAVSGQAVSFPYMRRLAASSRSFVLTGQGVIFTAGSKRVTANLGAFAVTGQTTNVRVAHLMPASARSFVLTGQAQTLSKSKMLTITAGAFALTGQTLGVTRNRVMAAFPEFYFTIGQSLFFKRTNAGAFGGGAFDVLGQTTRLLRGRRATAATGSFTVTGSAAGKQQTRIFKLPAGAFTLTGQELNVRRFRMATSTGFFTVTGGRTTLQYSRTGLYPGLPLLNTEGFLLTEIAGEWALLTADFGDGYLAAVNNGLPEGLRSWTIQIDVLPGEGAPIASEITRGFVRTEPGAFTLTEPGGKIILDQANTRAAYLWGFFRNSKSQGDQPFWFEVDDPATGTRYQYLANFTHEQLSYQILCARVYGTGLELLERRLPPPGG